MEGLPTQPQRTMQLVQTGVFLTTQLDVLDLLLRSLEAVMPMTGSTPRQLVGNWTVTTCDDWCGDFILREGTNIAAIRG